MNYKKILQIQEKLIKQKIKAIEKQDEIILKIFELSGTLKNLDEQSFRILKSFKKNDTELLEKILLEIFGTKEEELTKNLKNIEKLNKIQELFEQLIYLQPHYIERKK